MKTPNANYTRFLHDVEKLSKIINSANSEQLNHIAVGRGVFFTGSHAESYIRGNTIEIEANGSGIEFWASNNSTLDANIINLNDVDLNYTGIFLAGSDNNLLADNEITGAGLTGNDNIGIRVDSGQDNVYCCNTVDNTRIGVQFDGACQNFSMADGFFNGTDFGTHNIGLLLRSNAILGTQTHRQNTWSTASAVHDGGLQGALQSRFKVDDITDPIYRPSIITPSLGWFFTEFSPVNVNICSSDNCMITIPYIPENPDTKKVAMGEIQTVNYTNTIQWESERYLYSKLESVTLTDADIELFKQNSTNTSVGKFHTVKNDEKALFENNATERTLLTDNLNQIEINLGEMSALDELLSEATPTEYDGLMTDKQQLSNEVQILVEANLVLNETISINRILTAKSIGITNESINTTTVYENYAKRVNNIYLDFITHDMKGFGTEDLNTLQVIANQCPLEGGNAVYQARAMIALENIEQVYNDDLLCVGSQNLQMPDNSNSQNVIAGNKLKVYPNPAKNSLTIQWEIIDFEKGTLVFYDVLGKQILQQGIESGSNFQILNLQQLQSGLYLIQVKLDDKKPLIQRVIINK